jgi:hypothetical protein
MGQGGFRGLMNPVVSNHIGLGMDQNIRASRGETEVYLMKQTTSADNLDFLP